MKAEFITYQTIVVTELLLDKVQKIVDACIECGALTEPPSMGQHCFATYNAVVRALSVDIRNGEACNYRLQLPTPAIGGWISRIDPFLLADALREIDVDMSIAVFDVDNQNGLCLNGGQVQNQQNTISEEL